MIIFKANYKMKSGNNGDVLVHVTNYGLVWIPQKLIDDVKKTI